MLDWLYDCTTYGLCHSAVALEQISSTLLQLSPNHGPPSAVVACRNCVVRSLQLSPNHRLDIRIWIRSLLGSLDLICRAIHRSLILIYRIGEGEKIRTRVWSGTWVWIGVRKRKAQRVRSKIDYAFYYISGGNSRNYDWKARARKKRTNKKPYFLYY
jgi:hypothetical protein